MSTSLIYNKPHVEWYIKCLTLKNEVRECVCGIMTDFLHMVSQVYNCSLILSCITSKLHWYFASNLLEHF